MNRSGGFREIFGAHLGKYSDKWESYFEVYETHLRPHKSGSLDVLEIGVQNGGSLEVWAKFFENAQHIIGVDTEPLCGSLVFDDHRIRVLVEDASSLECGLKVDAISTNLGVVIDDGSHTSAHIIRSFSLFYPRLRPGGTYVIEDLHASYWADFGGGLHRPDSSMSFLKRLADVINHPHWGNGHKRMDLLASFTGVQEFLSEESLASIESLTFSDSMCVVRKNSEKSSGGLGTRVGSGMQALVNPGVVPLKGSSMQQRDEFKNPFSILLSEEEVVARLGEENASLREINSRMSQDLSSVVNSASWKITTPLRSFWRIILRLTGRLQAPKTQR